MINEENPHDKWTHVYTDRSATRAIIDGGAGILTKHPSSNSPYGQRKALQQLQSRDWSTHKSIPLDYRLVRSCLYSGLSYWCTFSPGSTDKQQIPRPSQSNEWHQCHLQLYLTVDTSTLWNNGQRRSWPFGSTRSPIIATRCSGLV